MMNDKIIELIARKLSGEASAEELDELNNSLLHNPESIYYTELISSLWKEQNTAFNSDIEADYLKHLERHQPEFEIPQLSEVNNTEAVGYHYNNPRSFFSKYKFALVVLFVAVLGSMIYFMTSQPVKLELVKAEKNIEHKAAKGAKKELILPDGTKVWLNADSKLCYDSQSYNIDKRMVYLSGEAFFDVTKNKEKPFIIKTKKISIKVLGTAFNVKAYPSEKITETTLLRGSIELTVNNKPYQKIMLKPNEKIVLIDSLNEESDINSAGEAQQHNPAVNNKARLVIQDIQPVMVANKEYVEEVSWVENNFVFQNETLEDLKPKMERWFNVTIEINSEALKGWHFTGIFHKETIDEALSAMQLIKPFKYKKNKNYVLIN